MVTVRTIILAALLFILTVFAQVVPQSDRVKIKSLGDYWHNGIKGGDLWHNVLVPKNIKKEELITIAKALFSERPGYYQVFTDDKEFNAFLMSDLHNLQSDKSDYPFPEKWFNRSCIATQARPHPATGPTHHRKLATPLHSPDLSPTLTRQLVEQHSHRKPATCATSSCRSCSDDDLIQYQAILIVSLIDKVNESLIDHDAFDRGIDQQERFRQPAARVLHRCNLGARAVCVDGFDRRRSIRTVAASGARERHFHELRGLRQSDVELELTAQTSD